MARVVVIGDVGGHPGELRRALACVGAVDDALPEDVTVVQVGDLVDRGPDSAGVLALVARIVDRQPDRWVQLAGNHESQYLPGGFRFWSEALSDKDSRLLAEWWVRGTMAVAAAVRTADGDDFLVTHAGLTVACWDELGQPATAAAAARLLNARPPLVWRGNDVGMNRAAGPLWAEAGWELCEPWLDHRGLVPFGQVHGHSSLVRYADRTWRCPGRVRQRATVDWQARQVRVRVGGRLFIGVDPKHGRNGAPEWEPLVLDGAQLLTGVEPVR